MITLRYILLFIALFGVTSATENINWSSTLVDEAKGMIGFSKDKNVTRDTRYKLVWKNSFDKFEEASNLELKLDNTPDASWKFWQTNKDDINEDIDSLINSIIDEIAGIDLLEYKRKVAKYREKIEELREDIAKLRESKILASTKEKKEYEDDIAKLKKQIKSIEDGIKEIKKELKKSFRENKISLNAKQIDTLLDRVDGDDIIEMSVILDILKYINSQIAQLVKESGEDLNRAKKYYAMHLVSLKLVVHIQQKYIDKVNSEYIPKLNKIEEKTKKLKYDTEIMIDKSSDERRALIYKKNLEAQNLTLRVVTLYKNALLKSIESVKKAQLISIENLKVADNTLKTVLLSSDLYSVISESKAMFNRVISIQMPEIVPFENLKIKQEFKKMTTRLLK